ncbi:DUF4926 domain-containing protein [Methylobacterium nonmethylotrophicum]|uniref:DUF4926 domain-containing protein n=1 Tax=Methylobacterium nonmethylotrophicum TaxID=1141884 RepID=A0A4Z0NN25_9HYPH|nr:DUF4926 domain-containing protein [Methylobacterium nonmethylotrophicum]
MSCARRGEGESQFRDLDGVLVTIPVTTGDGDAIPAGTEGTIVGIWRDGAACEVEFAQPPGALATVAADGLTLVVP